MSSPVHISEPRGLWEGQAEAREDFLQEAAKCSWVGPQRDEKVLAKARPCSGQTDSPYQPEYT